jgi:hypothetical protein
MPMAGYNVLRILQENMLFYYYPLIFISVSSKIHFTEISDIHNNIFT